MGIRACEPQAQCKDANDQGAKERSEDRAAATEERDAADHDGDDAFNVQELSGRR